MVPRNTSVDKIARRNPRIGAAQLRHYPHLHEMPFAVHQAVSLLSTILVRNHHGRVHAKNTAYSTLHTVCSHRWFHEAVLSNVLSEFLDLDITSSLPILPHHSFYWFNYFGSLCNCVKYKKGSQAPHAICAWTRMIYTRWSLTF